MPPIWDPSESGEAFVYARREQHSEGMISFAYEPPTAETREAVRKALGRVEPQGTSPATKAEPPNSTLPRL